MGPSKNTVRGQPSDTVKLHNLDHSPYSARVRVLVRYKSLPVDIVAPALPLRSAEFAARYPLGKIPLLELDDGAVIGESAVILRYLEACYPQPPLLPEGALQQARDGMLTAYADLHLAPALFPLFGALIGSADIDLAGQLSAIGQQLLKLERLLAQWPADAAELSLGAICLAPVMAYTLEVCGAFGGHAMLAEVDATRTWWEGLQRHPVVSDTLTEMLAAHRALLPTLQQPAPAGEEVP
jgi:glutathione S-transferase